MNEDKNSYQNVRSRQSESSTSSQELNPEPCTSKANKNPNSNSRIKNTNTRTKITFKKSDLKPKTKFLPKTSNQVGNYMLCDCMRTQIGNKFMDNHFLTMQKLVEAKNLKEFLCDNSLATNKANQKEYMVRNSSLVSNESLKNDTSTSTSERKRMRKSEENRSINLSKNCKKIKIFENNSSADQIHLINNETDNRMNKNYMHNEEKNNNDAGKKSINDDENMCQIKLTVNISLLGEKDVTNNSLTEKSNNNKVSKNLLKYDNTSPKVAMVANELKTENSDPASKESPITDDPNIYKKPRTCKVPTSYAEILSDYDDFTNTSDDNTSNLNSSSDESCSCEDFLVDDYEKQRTFKINKANSTSMGSRESITNVKPEIPNGEISCPPVFNSSFKINSYNQTNTKNTVLISDDSCSCEGSDDSSYEEQDKFKIYESNSYINRKGATEFTSGEKSRVSNREIDYHPAFNNTFRMDLTNNSETHNPVLISTDSCSSEDSQYGSYVEQEKFKISDQNSFVGMDAKEFTKNQKHGISSNTIGYFPTFNSNFSIDLSINSETKNSVLISDDSYSCEESHNVSYEEQKKFKINDLNSSFVSMDDRESSAILKPGISSKETSYLPKFNTTFRTDLSNNSETKKPFLISDDSSSCEESHYISYEEQEKFKSSDPSSSVVSVDARECIRNVKPGKSNNEIGYFSKFNNTFRMDFSSNSEMKNSFLISDDSKSCEESRNINYEEQNKFTISDPNSSIVGMDTIESHRREKLRKRNWKNYIVISEDSCSSVESHYNNHEEQGKLKISESNTPVVDRDAREFISVTPGITGSGIYFCSNTNRAKISIFSHSEANAKDPFDISDDSSNHEKSFSDIAVVGISEPNTPVVDIDARESSATPGITSSGIYYSSANNRTKIHLSKSEANAKDPFDISDDSSNHEKSFSDIAIVGISEPSTPVVDIDARESSATPGITSSGICYSSANNGTKIHLLSKSETNAKDPFVISEDSSNQEQSLSDNAIMGSLPSFSSTFKMISPFSSFEDFQCNYQYDEENTSNNTGETSPMHINQNIHIKKHANMQSSQEITVQHEEKIVDSTVNTNNKNNTIWFEDFEYNQTYLLNSSSLTKNPLQDNICIPDTSNIPTGSNISEPSRVEDLIIDDIYTLDLESWASTPSNECSSINNSQNSTRYMHDPSNMPSSSGSNNNLSQSRTTNDNYITHYNENTFEQRENNKDRSLGPLYIVDISSWMNNPIPQNEITIPINSTLNDAIPGSRSAHDYANNDVSSTTDFHHPPQNQNSLNTIDYIEISSDDEIDQIFP